MSFGLLKHFKDLKKHPSEEKQTAHFKHIIIGQDLGAVLKLVELRKNNPSDSVKLISSRPINKNTLIENYQYDVARLRSEAAVKEVFKKFYDVKVSSQEGEPQFYKDGKFHDFGGRAKSMNLLEGENFFIPKAYRIEVASLFSNEDWENLDEILAKYQDIKIFESIEKTNPQDLVEKQEWLLSFKDFHKAGCENLYVSMSPKKFQALLSNKSSVTPELIDFCSSIKIQAAISVTWILNKEVSRDERTFFIPQSMTHEWGHFIVEFETFNTVERVQLCHALFLLHEEEPQTEDLASKIKLMKRVIERVFPDFESHITKEHIRFDDEMFMSEVKDQLIEQISFDYPSLKFIGQMSPMPSGLEDEKYMARVLLS